MTVFLILLILALLGVTFWQLSQIFKLSQGKGSVSQIANDKDNSLQGKLMLYFVIFLYGLMIYCFTNYWSYFLPAGSSAHSEDYDRLMMISVVLIMFVQFLTQFFLHYFAFKYKGKKGVRATYFPDNDTLEIVWTVIPIITLAGLILYGLSAWTDITNIDEDDEDAIVIELYAYQFGWRARYSGADNVLGKANVRFIEGVNTLGIDASDAYAMDDIVTDQLHLPVNKKIIFKLRSQDILHSAYMPHFRAQMNVVPGMITQFSYTPIETTEEIRQTEFMIEKVATINKIRAEKSKELVAKGEEALEPYEFNYYLLCNKICGASHFNMQMKIVVESEEDYRNWLAEQKTFRQVASN